MINVEVISLEKLVETTQAVEVLLPGVEGQLGIRTGHLPLITPIVAGEVVIKKSDGKEEVLVVFGGFAEVFGNTVRLMVDSAERATDLSEHAIQAAIEHARKHQATLSGDRKINETLTSLEVNVARLKAVRRQHHRGH